MRKYEYYDDCVDGVIGEKTVETFSFSFSGWYFMVLVTHENEYYNYYIIDGITKEEPLNQLELQSEERLKKHEVELLAMSRYSLIKLGYVLEYKKEGG